MRMMMRCFGLALVIMTLGACSGDDGTLVLPCVTDGECPTAQICDNGMCKASCPGTPCGPGESCTAEGRCIATGCAADIECGTDALCVAGSCVPACPATPCVDGSVCTEGLCVPDDTGTTCLPSCDARTCGPDGCGGSCGDCGADAPLCNKGECFTAADCTDTCDSTGWTCSDVCGEACGTCDEGTVCSIAGACECVDTCEGMGMVCGDVCGESCGTCADGETCSDGQCAVADSCADTGCAPPLVCNEESGVCEEPAATTGDVCTSCATNDDCPSGWNCIALSSGKTCLKPCNTNDVCDTGWSCVGSPAVCTPDVSYSCAGCVATGCANGEACDPASGDCSPAKAQCDGCSENWECGPGAGCITEPGGAQTCMPRCGLGTSDCPESAATCSLDNDSQLYVCSEVCGAATEECSGATPVLVEGECVQCADDADCSGGGVCNMNNNTCESAECSGDTPFLVEGECVACLTNADCPDGASCNADSHECTTEECGECNEDYPVCLELQGDTYCVQCTDDSHCDAGCTCDTQLYACSGDCVVAGSEQCGGDTGESCPSGLVCENSLCIDPTGACDGVTVMCPGGNQCVSLLELLMGGAGGGGQLPLPPGTGGGIPGVCGCNPAANDCASGIPCTELGGGGGACIDCGPLAMLGGGLEKVLICAFLGL